MSKLYKKVPLLVSRLYYHGGDGLEKGSHTFFRSMHEYAQLAEKNNWEKGDSFKSSWCTPPVLMEVLVEGNTYRKFMGGSTLYTEDVFFPGNSIDEAFSVGQ